MAAGGEIERMLAHAFIIRGERTSERSSCASASRWPTGRSCPSPTPALGSPPSPPAAATRLDVVPDCTSNCPAVQQTLPW
eukprot:1883626-Rhodomonas_salina.3